MIPANILTNIVSTNWSLLSILNAYSTYLSVVILPISKKLAGIPLCVLIISIVAIAYPVPLTIQPILTSNAI